MNNKIEAKLRFLTFGPNLILICLVLISISALADYFAGGFKRVTFLYYTALEGKPFVEERMLRKSGSRETDIRRYLEDALLGPVFPDSMPIIPREVKLESLLLRRGSVYAAFSGGKDLAWEKNEVYTGFLTLNEGIRRNFPLTKEINFFMDGVEIYTLDFSKKVTKSADKF